MAFEVDEKTGNITLVQGDSGKLFVNDLPTDKTTYIAYLSIYDSKRRQIGDVVPVNTGGYESIVFTFTPKLTSLLTVKTKEEYAEYYYGVKVCDRDTQFEDTLLIGENSKIGDVNTITVYPKKSEGIPDEEYDNITEEENEGT